MTAPVNTFTTATAIGIREDLSDIIYRISPTATPLLNLAAKNTATATLHEWQVQDLAAASIANIQAEGDDASAKVVTPTVRLSNRTQIATKTVIVSGTQQAVNSAGRKNEMGTQMALASAEIKRDMESMLCQLDVTAAAPRQARGLPGWIVDNVDRNLGTLASYTGNTGRTVGTQRAFTEAMLKNVMQQCYTAGGDPDTVMVGPAQKQTFSTFTGGTTRFDKSEDSKLTASIDFYVGDFGTVEVIPNRFQLTRDAYVLQSDKVAISYLRPFQTKDLAATGDSEKKEIIVEYTLEMRAPKAHGAIYDLL
jgi:Family of unknown function (DUF5309)